MLSYLKDSTLILKLLKKFRTNSLFYKMIAVTTTTVIVLSMICFAGIYLIKSSMTKNEMNNNQVYLDYSYSYLENLMKNLKDVFYSIENDVDLNTLLRVSHSDINQEYIETNNVYKKLAIIKPTIDEISTIYVYLNKQKVLLMPNGTYDSQTFYNRFYEGDVDQWEGMIANGKHQNNIEIWDSPLNRGNMNEPADLSRLNVVKSIYADGEQKGAIVANLRKDLINKLYAGKEFASKRKIYITDLNLNVILSNDASSDVQLALHDPSTQRGSYEDQSGHVVTYQKSAQNNIIFFVSVPKAVIFENIKSMEIISISLIVFILLVGLTVSVYLSQRFYYPISQVLNDIEKISLYSRDHMSKQNEMSYIKNNFMRIYNSNNELEQTVKEGVPVLVDIIFLKVLLGDREVDHAMALCEKFNIEFAHGFYTVTVIKLTRTYRDQILVEPAAVTDIINQTISQFPIKTFRLAENEYSLVTYCEDEGQNRELLLRMQELGDRLDELCAYNSTVIGLGKTVHSLFEIEQSRETALLAIQQRKVMDERSVVDFFNADHPENDKAVLPIDMEQRLTSYIMQGSIDASGQYTREILDSNYKRNITYGSYFHTCSSIQDILIRIMNQHSRGNAQDAELDIMDRIEKIDSIYDVTLLSEQVMSNIKTVSSYFFNKKKATSTFDKIIEYVDSSYMLDINLNTVADKFGYNANYLSKILRQHKGMSFSEYIIKKRIDHSKVLLAESTLPIKDVAEKSGYNSSSVFIRAFSKIVGMPPGEYRRDFTA
ncbi:helix-turn-helix transcriptional regulator [Paenibacillus eucommiae]|uniref:AraC-like DNA-binding protein n=1 Tax=Paenibacillus eucommiae TaxID=1355755 RepID=A0ABS4IRG9_9BACL|nr:AraC family transcriptional regulator [Paenibacillus eucommiae]MBP1990169.1 AraC-like DNA-binding protein [Paenibacillus eucommiae]